uniref:Uncharacterized protein n=1 Tax=Chromera velia CCMP2878 TaxID=1169474 RepID=A0A0G4GDG1_9ALVE|eukprot:Cvel_21325.t1-p1 / transcript=Cvel_21325.t1 / gene=Cvel_21325 / organism=Chromera_velia_CCMP2878 / gene_product=hypothetical protein / transcript_product=hypothetical protein / location=Cvel_scaffold1988:31269-31595(-) / protein_length=109 / sequence_SO=supercontig / SO=protein_coding / is_pseudo=false
MQGPCLIPTSSPSGSLLISAYWVGGEGNAAATPSVPGLKVSARIAEQTATADGGMKRLEVVLMALRGLCEDFPFSAPAPSPSVCRCIISSICDSPLLEGGELTGLVGIP